VKKNIPAIVSVFVSIVVVLFVIYLYRRGRYKVEQGELEGQDIISGMETWDSKSNEVIKNLHPKIKKIVTDFINDLYKQGIKYRTYSGNRTFIEQSELYGKGRTEEDLSLVGIDKKYSKPTEKIVTYAKPGSSYHNYGLAFDGVEVKDGQAIWNSNNEQKIVDTAKVYNLYWGGNFTNLKDKPHFEYKQFGTISQLLTLYNSGKKDNNGYLIV